MQLLREVITLLVLGAACFFLGWFARKATAAHAMIKRLTEVAAAAPAVAAERKRQHEETATRIDETAGKTATDIVFGDSDDRNDGDSLGVDTGDEPRADHSP